MYIGIHLTSEASQEIDPVRGKGPICNRDPVRCSSLKLQHDLPWGFA